MYQRKNVEIAKALSYDTSMLNHSFLEEKRDLRKIVFPPKPYLTCTTLHELVRGFVLQVRYAGFVGSLQPISNQYGVLIVKFDVKLSPRYPHEGDGVAAGTA